LSAADIGHIAREIETMGLVEKCEIVSRLTVLSLHLFKSQFPPPWRGPG
jgi:Domain of unknown function DUF29